MKKLSESLLKSLGLTENQAQVYLAALELGQASMQELAKKSKVRRTSIYNFINELKEKQLITETKKKKRRVYSAVHPEQLIELEKTRITELQSMLPELLAVYNSSNQKPRVTYYEGVDGIKEVYGDMLKDKKEIWAWEDLEYMKTALPKNFYDYFPPERAKRGITFKSISRDSETAKELVKSNIKLLRETKFIQSQDWGTEINIYGNKVALFNFKTQNPFVVLIEDINIAQTLRIAWKGLWDRLGEPIG